MELPTTELVNGSIKVVSDAARKGGADPADIGRVQTWAKSFETIIRAYGQGGVGQMEKVLHANFEALLPAAEGLAQAAGQPPQAKKGK